MSSAHEHEPFSSHAPDPAAPTRASALISLSEIGIDLGQISDFRLQLCAAAVVERCARELCVELHHVSVMVDRALSQVRASRRLEDAVARYRHSPIAGTAERDVHGYVRLLRAATGRSATAALDLVEALVWSGRIDWAAEEARALSGTQGCTARDMVELGVRRDRRRGGHDRFVADLTEVGAAERFGASLPLVVECVRRFASAPRDDLARAARHACSALPRRDRDLAAGYAVALVYIEGGLDAAVRESARLGTVSDRQRALLVVVEAAILRGHGRDAARVMPLGRGGAALRGRLAFLQWLHARKHLRAARRLAARLDLPREVRSRVITSLRTERIWLPDLHRPRCTCTSCRLPRLYPRSDGRMRSGDQERADDIIAAAVRTLTAPSSLTRRHDRWFEAGLCAAPRPPADVRDPRDLARALFDEGISLSARRATRRGVLIRAARQALAAELTQAGSVPAPVLASRLRSLRNLAGALAARMLRQLLRDHPSSSAWWSRAFEVLCASAPAEARDLVAVHYVRIPRDADVLGILARSGVVSRDIAARWIDLEQKQAERLGRLRAREWVAELIATWRSRYGTLPPPDALRIERWPAALTARSALASHAQLVERHLAHAPRELVRAAIADDQLRRSLSLIAPARLPADESPWSDDRTRDELALLLSEASGVVDRQFVSDFLKCLPIPPAGRARAKAELLAGRLPTTTCRQDLAPGWHGRLLDKRRDLLTFLRLADPVWCCLHTESPYLRDRRRWIADAWHDPLTFCVHIDRTRAACVEPAGFILGGFGLVADAPALILNGVYLRGVRRSAIRAAALQFLERCVAGPLGIRLIGVAARNGGAGALPEAYALARRRVLRTRALSRGGVPVRRTYDDISTVVNQPEDVELWWKDARDEP
jgi:hypothetical protein